MMRAPATLAPGGRVHSPVWPSGITRHVPPRCLQSCSGGRLRAIRASPHPASPSRAGRRDFTAARRNGRGGTGPIPPSRYHQAGDTSHSCPVGTGAVQACRQDAGNRRKPGWACQSAPPVPGHDGQYRHQAERWRQGLQVASGHGGPEWGMGSSYRLVPHAAKRGAGILITGQPPSAKPGNRIRAREGLGAGMPAPQRVPRHGPTHAA